MAERRVQVRELDVPSLSSVTPTASPVETYVRPEQVRSEPGALSDFISAIAPVVEVASKQKLQKILEREKKIEDGRFLNQLNDLDTYALQVGFNLNKDWLRNQEEYLNLRDDTTSTAAEKITAIRQTYVDENVEALEREGVDELLVQTFKNEMKKHNNQFLANVYLPGKEAVKKAERENGLKEAFNIILETTKDIPREERVEIVNQKYLRHVNANGGNHAEALDTLWQHGVDIAPYNADNALVDWFKSPLSSPKGQPPQWLVGKRTKQRAIIEKAIRTQAEQNKKELTKQYKTKLIGQSTLDNFNSGTFGNLALGTMPGPTGDDINITPQEYSPYIDAAHDRQVEMIDNNPSLPANIKEARKTAITSNRYAFYSTFGIVPPEIKRSVGNAVRFLSQGDLVNYPERVQQLAEMYAEVSKADAYTAGKISPIVFSGDDGIRFNLLNIMVKKAKMPFETAANNVQGPLHKTRNVKLEKDELRSYLDHWLPLVNMDLEWTGKGATATNLQTMEEEIVSVAEALLQTGTAYNEEEAKKLAIEEVTSNYKYIRSSDGIVTALRIDNNALNNPGSVEQMEEDIKELRYHPVTRSIINNIVGTKDTVEGASTFGGGTPVGNFDVFVRQAANPNQITIFAKPKGESQASSLVAPIATINIFDYNQNKIQSMKDQVLKQALKAVEEGTFVIGQPEQAVDSFYSLATVPPSDDAFVATMQRAIGDNGIPYPPVRPEELGGPAPLSVPQRKIANAEVRQAERIQRNIELNKEALSETIVTDQGSSSWIRSIGTAIGKVLFGSDAESAELQGKANEAVQSAATNPLEFVLNNRYLGLSEKDPDHQKAIAGFMNRAVKGRVKNPSDMQLDSNAWCAAFAGHVLSSLGLASPQRYDALRASSYLKLGRGISIDKAQPGDLVVMKTRLQNGKTQWHAGFFVEHDGGKTFKLLGGNQKDQVNVQNNTVANIAGIRRISNVQKINPDALKAVQRDMTFFGKLQNYLLGYRAK